MEPFIGLIVMFGGNFAPRGWAHCNGQLLSIESHSALFSILGTTYGGDGRSTFALPDLRGRSIVQHGEGPGLKHIRLGEKGGQETISLTVAEMPSHSHSAVFKVADANNADTEKAKNKAFAQNSSTNIYSKNPSFSEGNKMDSNVITVQSTGAGRAFDNRAPYIGVNICIALEGTFPTRS